MEKISHKNTEKRYPIIIENVEAGGHYRVIFGYDELSRFTKNENNDMLIFSDPADNLIATTKYTTLPLLFELSKCGLMIIICQRAEKATIYYYQRIEKIKKLPSGSFFTTSKPKSK